MGCCFPTVFNPTNLIEGQGVDAIKVFNTLGFTKSDVNVLYRYFKTIDFNDSGTIDVNEFICVNNLDTNNKNISYAEIIFRLFDKNQDARLNFTELSIALWVFCSYRKDDLAYFTFQVFDTDNSGILSTLELKYMISLIWSHKIDNHVTQALDVLDHNKDSEVSINEFIKYSKSVPILLFPIFEMQNMLRGKTLGNNRWYHISETLPAKKSSQAVKDLVEPTNKHKALFYILQHDQKIPEQLKFKLTSSNGNRRQRKKAPNNSAAPGSMHKEDSVKLIQAAARGKIARKKVAQLKNETCLIHPAD
jgi:Ca2+-binding EF-hand superfamily protein